MFGRILFGRQAAASEPPLGARLEQALHQTGGAGEEHAIATARCLDADSMKHGLAGPDRAGEISSSARPMKSQLESPWILGRATPLSASRVSDHPTPAFLI